MVSTLADLINSSAQVESLYTKGHYAMNKALQKPFGTIYYNNKVVYYNARYNIIEIRMTMGTATETAYEGYHAIRVAIYGAEGKIYDSLEDLYNDRLRYRRDYSADPNNTLERRHTSKEDTQGDVDKLRKAVTTGDKFSEINDKRKFIGRDIDRVDVDYGEEISKYLDGCIIPCATNGSSKLGENFKTDGRFFYLAKPIDLNSYARVSCSCSDYYHTFAYYNNKEGCHLGTAPANTSASAINDKSPKRNVNGNIGMCKHLMMFVMLLITGGIITPLDEATYIKDRKAILNREEKLVVPRKLAEGTSLNRIYNRLSKNIKETMQDRANEAGIAGKYSSEFSEYLQRQRSIRAKKLQTGAYKGSINKGLSFGKYEYEDATTRMYREMVNKFGTEDSFKYFAQKMKPRRQSGGRQS